MKTTEDLIALIDGNHAAIVAQHQKTNGEMNGFGTRMTALEQEVVRKGGGSGHSAAESFGSIVTRHAEFNAVAALAGRRGKHTLSVKAMITSLPDSGGALVAPDVRTDPVMLARRRLIVRNLIGPGTTNSNLVEFPRQTVRDLNADVVSEGIKKPESNIAFEIVDAPVRVIAHYVKTSKQILADVAQLRSTLDGEMRYGIALAEDLEFLLGDGTGQHLYGIIPQATAYETTRDKSGDTRLDTLAHAIAQAQVALLPATGIVMNDDDVEALKIIKDGQGRYILGGPGAPPLTGVWGRPIVGTPIMPAGSFLAGAFFDGAQVFDRETVDVVVATENEDDFVSNKATVLCEERLAFAVKRPQAFITGSFPVGSGI